MSHVTFAPDYFDFFFSVYIITRNKIIHVFKGDYIYVRFPLNIYLLQ